MTAQGAVLISEQEAITYAKCLKKTPEVWSAILQASTRSLRYASSRPAQKVMLCIPDSPGLEALPPAPGRTETPARRVVTYGHAARTLKRLNALLPAIQNDPEILASQFHWIRLGPDFLCTGYYEPILEASPVQTAKYRYPLYKPPKNLKRMIACNGRYYSRRAIDQRGALRGCGLELAWVEDPIDISILQIQGSGKLLYPDGSSRNILYAAQNGHRYKALGRIMKDLGLLKDPITMYSIKSWLKAHPDETPEILCSDPSYVFFRLGKKGCEGSFGSMGAILTPNTSIAVDQSVLPNGLVAFMSVLVPDRDTGQHKPFQSVMFPQDSGGAIKGHRIDLFFGNGPQAEYAASCMKQYGSVILLLAK